MIINRFPQNRQHAQHTQLTDLRTRFPAAEIYALIEGVLNETCYPLLKRSGRLPYYALFANTPTADEETLCISPILVKYTETGRSTWDELLKKTDGRPALSLIVTTESLTQLAERLIPWCVVDAAGCRLALSFADTRILPELFTVLTPQQLRQFCGAARLWQYVSRKAEWEALPLTEISQPPATDVVLDEQQYAQLMTAAEADNVLFQLRASAANLVDCHSPARAHELVRHWLMCADHARIEAAPDRFELCELGLAYPALELDPQIMAWLEMPSQRTTLETLRAQWLRQGGFI